MEKKETKLEQALEEINKKIGKEERYLSGAATISSQLTHPAYAEAARQSFLESQRNLSFLLQERDRLLSKTHGSPVLVPKSHLGG